MPLTLHCQQIRPDQLETFSSLICGVARDLEQRGQKLWEPDQLTPERLLQDYGLESMHLGRINSEAVASFVLLENDPKIWPNIPEGESIFIHKVAVARAWKGHNFSQQILDFAVAQVLERDKKFLRLDTDITRPVLCKLYENYGFVQVGRCQFGGFDMALYELEIRA
jgi:GNAT superfamily N-acetyltransferase